MLLLFAGKDQRIPTEESARAILGALHSRGRTDVTVKSFPNADHTFALPVANGGWPKHVPDYADLMITWANAAVHRQHLKLHS